MLEAVTVYKRSHEIAVSLDPGKTGRSKRFTKLFSSRERWRAARRLDAYEKAALFTFGLHLAQHTNLIVGRGESGVKGLPLSMEEIAQAVGVSKPTMVRVMRQLAEKGIVRHLGRGKGYVVNPALMMNGPTIEPATAELFENSGG